jgi:Ni/Co efflux regulator RcnB
MEKAMWYTGAWVLVASLALAGVAQADKHGKHDRDDDDDRGRRYYSDRDRDYLRGWYHEHDHDDHLPPGLAKRDQLPPGLERRLRVRGTVPPDLREHMAPCPEEMERHLPPPPLGCAHVLIGGHVVLVNRSSYVVLDIFHFER